MSITFRYEVRNGWLGCGLTVGGVSVWHPVNGWHDGLRDLLRAACEMVGRARAPTALFQEEPGEFRWRITRLTANRLRVRVIEFSDWGTGLPDETGTLRFDQPCGAVAFARAIYEGTGTRLGDPDRDRLGDLLGRYEFGERPLADADAVPGAAPDTGRM